LGDGTISVASELSGLKGAEGHAPFMPKISAQEQAKRNGPDFSSGPFH
jgi:hypothetical protein